MSCLSEQLVTSPTVLPERNYPRVGLGQVVLKLECKDQPVETWKQLNLTILKPQDV